jgi:membrane protease YdiL (CAAX protease family)
MNPASPLHDSPEKRFLIASAWTAMLLISDLPDVIWNGFLGQVPAWLFWIKVGFLVLFFGLCLIWKRIRPLWQYASIMLVFYLAFAASIRIGDTAWWQSRFGGRQPSFTLGYAGAYIRDAGVAFAVIAGLWLIKRRRSEFFLAKGQLDAAIGPVRWLGIRKGESWRTFGWIFALVAGVGVLIPTILGLHVSTNMLSRAAPLLPVVLLFAAINAFTEEIYYRASLLSTLHEVVGKSHALLINVVFFGLAHYLYGSPPGVVGLLMTGFLAWLMGKSMLETKGMWWAWLIHFLPDVVIFVSYALLWVKR